MRTKEISKAEQFFYEHAGWSYGSAKETEEEGRARGAQELARAEEEAERRAWSVEWVYDEEPCLSCECGSSECPCFTGEPHETYTAILYPDGLNYDPHNVLASLGSICEPSREYRRVINAELALEALSEESARIASVV